MPDWCPKCHAMLPSESSECPRCGIAIQDRVNNEQVSFGRRDLIWITGYTIAIVAIPIIIGVVIGLICLLFYLS